jgi:hypothetical protein
LRGGLRFYYAIARVSDYEIALAIKIIKNKRIKNIIK